MRSLFEISPFEQLAGLCAEFSINLTAYGGTVTRALLAEGEKNLFDLAPFTCDVDLYHSGLVTLTPRVVRELFARMPMAECFRWEVRAQSEIARLESNCNVIPARSLALSNDRNQGIIDRYRGLDDIESRKFRFLRHPKYEVAPAFQAGLDLEIFSALLYLRLLCEAEIDASQVGEQPGLATARAIFASASDFPTLVRLQSSSYLRMRLQYLLDALAAAVPSETSYRTLMDQSGFDSFIAFLGQHDRSLSVRFGSENILLPSGAKIVSAHLGGDIYRASRYVGWSGRGPLSLMSRVDPNQTVGAPTAQSSVDPQAANGNIILAALEPVHLTPGHSKSSATGGFNHEFIHFQIDLPALENWAWEIHGSSQVQSYNMKVLEERLTLAFELVIEGAPQWISLPTCVSMRRGGSNGPDDTSRLFMRANAYGLLNAVANDPAGSGIPMNVLLLGLQHQALGYSEPMLQSDHRSGPSGEGADSSHSDNLQINEREEEHIQETENQEEEAEKELIHNQYGNW